MGDNFKVVLHEIFQWLIILSVPFIICFYWPNHDARLMKFLCFEIYVNVLLGMSFLFTTKRTVNNLWPALFFVAGFINLFTHGLSNTVNIGLSFIVPSIIAIYLISNHLHTNMIPALKKTIVITCLLNCALFLTQTLGLDIVFIVHKQTWAEPWEGRPSAFMIHPANFGLICSIGLILAWEWRKWLCLPIGLCLCLSHEYSVIAGLLAVVCVPFLYDMRRYVPRYYYFIPLAIISFALFHFWGDILGKLAVRTRYLFPVFQNVWARPLDGWGLGQYNRLPESFFGFSRGNWSELHCEPLDLLFSMGFLGVAVVGGWIYSFVKGFTWNLLTKCLIIIAITSCFHSVFHFVDSLYLCIVVYALWEIERHEQSESIKRPENFFGATEDSTRRCYVD
jgi:hypothetical protein